MSRDSEKLTGFRMSHELAVEVSRLTATYPLGERFGLQAQLRRAAVSTPSSGTKDSRRWIVLALRPGRFLTAGLMKWLGKWAARRTWREAASAVIGGRRNDPLSGPSIARLSRFARRQGLGFFFDFRKPGKDKLEASILNLREREIAITPTLQSILE